MYSMREQALFRLLRMQVQGSAAAQDLRSFLAMTLHALHEHGGCHECHCRSREVEDFGWMFPLVVLVLIGGRSAAWWSGCRRLTSLRRMAWPPCSSRYHNVFATAVCGTGGAVLCLRPPFQLGGVTNPDAGALQRDGALAF